MSKFPFILILFVFLFAGAAMFFQGDTSKEMENAQKQRLQVAATIFPLYDMVRTIAGDAADVTLVVPPGVSPHVFKLLPTQIEHLQQTNIIFSIGGIDDWTGTLVSSVPGIEEVPLETAVNLLPSRDFVGEAHQIKEVNEMESASTTELAVEEVDKTNLKGSDPHYWLSVRNAKLMAKRVYERLVKRDPLHAEEYANNFGAYMIELDALDSEIHGLFENASSTQNITLHDSWQYFDAAYELETVAVIEVEPGVQPSPDVVKEIHAAVEEYGISTIFSESQLSSDHVTAIAQDLELTEYVLDPLGGDAGRNSYSAMMRYNAQVIHDALTK